MFWSNTQAFAEDMLKNQKSNFITVPLILISIKYYAPILRVGQLLPATCVVPSPLAAGLPSYGAFPAYSVGAVVSSATTAST